MTKINDLATNYSQKYNVEIENYDSSRALFMKKYVKLLDMISADLIVMGTNGSPQGIAKFIGSNA